MRIIFCMFLCWMIFTLAVAPAPAPTTTPSGCGPGFGTTDSGANCVACPNGISFKRDFGNIACTPCAINTVHCGGTYAGMCVDGYTRDKDGACQVTVLKEEKNVAGAVVGGVLGGLCAIWGIYYYMNRDDGVKVKLLKTLSESHEGREASVSKQLFKLKSDSKYTNLPGAAKV